jgi:hypothetical protein
MKQKRRVAEAKNEPKTAALQVTPLLLDPEFLNDANTASRERRVMTNNDDTKPKKEQPSPEALEMLVAAQTAPIEDIEIKVPWLFSFKARKIDRATFKFVACVLACPTAIVAVVWKLL